MRQARLAAPLTLRARLACKLPPGSGSFPRTSDFCVSNLSSEPALRIKELRVDYGDLVAVDHLTLEIPAGEIYGLVGPNGAGKTSTFRVLATLMRPTYGEVAFCGLDLFEKTAA